MPVSIRSRLLLLVLSVMLPAVLGVVWLVDQTYQAEREANVRTLRETARALSMVVDAELNLRATAARVLAKSRWLDAAPAPSRDDLLRFETLARRALWDMDGWIELHAPGRLLLDTRMATGVLPPQPSLASPAVGNTLHELPVIIPLQVSPVPGQTHAGVIEPVQRDGRTLLNLVLTLRPSELQRVVEKQRLPEGWVGTVLDSHGIVVARKPGGSQYLGRSATPDMHAVMAQGKEGLFESTSLEGVRTAGYYSTSARGWTFVTAMPRSQFAGLQHRAVLQTAAGALALLALAVAGALWVARRIAGPVQALKHDAERMQNGLPVAHRRSGIVECDEVGNALAEAAETLQRGRIELERQVAAAVERTRIAEQRVSQSQRVEALGRLTGGVAHDFNNLLGVISNSAHLIQRHAAAPELQAPVAATLRAVETGSRLIQHLLRFAGRRPLHPQVLEPARVLPELQEVMRTVLGRQVEVMVQVAAGTAPVCVDAAELELALLNLALNARDAMPSGGELRLCACNAGADDAEGLPAGRYVLITVSDDGMGMAPEVAARALEPFFTTKAVGKGTGLGLSQVLGFCTQAGGVARLASTPGLGTTVSMLLPASGAEPGGVPEPAADPRAIEGRQVLLVEDNIDLGDVTAALLRSHGAQVLRAADAAEALALLDTPAPVDVVLSDVVMPGSIDGLALARRLRDERPALPVVLISGYNTRAAAAGEFVVLQKPCTQEALLGALLAAIACARPRPGF